MHLKNSKKQLTRVNVDGKIVKLSQSGGLKGITNQRPKKRQSRCKNSFKKTKKNILTMRVSDGRIYIADHKSGKRRHM